ncbi:uncharacterized protein B0T15DRAFT_63572 [Chaetomium strumarium]|uniref:Uncharacterized protein n=1 Tax=Chaetomium strumarium TaxID=1170767 RepID=A0AAJ0H3G4_9PEZI|nr:hypothetical protein B0T15DRAFT_63572 [Chaetomium strumarium]
MGLYRGAARQFVMELGLSSASSLYNTQVPMRNGCTCLWSKSSCRGPLSDDALALRSLIFPNSALHQVVLGMSPRPTPPPFKEIKVSSERGARRINIEVISAHARRPRHLSGRAVQVDVDVETSGVRVADSSCRGGRAPCRCQRCGIPVPLTHQGRPRLRDLPQQQRPLRSTGAEKWLRPIGVFQKGVRTGPVLVRGGLPRRGNDPSLLLQRTH